MNHRFPWLTAAVLGGVLVLSTTSPVRAADASATRTIEQAPPVEGAAGQTLTIDNLLGEVEVRPADGRPRIVATVHAGAPDQAGAEALAKRIGMTLTSGDSGPRVHVDYPLADYTTYVYRASAANEQDDDSSLMNGVAAFFRVFWGGGSNQVEYDGTTVHVIGRPSNTAADLHVDLKIILPRDMSIKLHNRVGPVTAYSIARPARLQVDQGPVGVRDMGGAVDLRTGSGQVDVQGDRGNVTIASGSGDVTVEDVAGAVYTKQGSGDFQGRDLREGLTGKAGSGDFRLEGLQGPLQLRLGSGDVIGSKLSRVDSVDIHTGSGNVTLAGDLSGLTELSLVSGSGNARLQTSAVPSLHLNAQTQSGDIDVRWPGGRHVTSGDGRYEATFGTGQGTGRITTGSGNISLLGS